MSVQTFDETQHPRGAGGRFVEKPPAGEADPASLPDPSPDPQTIVTSVPDVRADLLSRHSAEEVDAALARLHPRHGMVLDADQVDRAERMISDPDDRTLADCECCGNEIADNLSPDIKTECNDCNEYYLEDRHDYGLVDGDGDTVPGYEGYEVGAWVRRTAAGLYGDEIATRASFEMFDSYEEVTSDHGDTERVLGDVDQDEYYARCQEIYEEEVYRPVHDSDEAREIATLPGVASVQQGVSRDSFDVTTDEGHRYTVVGSGRTVGVSWTDDTGACTYQASTSQPESAAAGTALRRSLASVEAQRIQHEAVVDTLTELGDDVTVTSDGVSARGLTLWSVRDGDRTEAHFTDDENRQTLRVLVDGDQASVEIHPFDDEAYPVQGLSDVEDEPWAVRVARGVHERGSSASARPRTVNPA